MDWSVLGSDLVNQVGVETEVSAHPSLGSMMMAHEVRETRSSGQESDNVLTIGTSEWLLSMRYMTHLTTSVDLDMEEHDALKSLSVDLGYHISLAANPPTLSVQSPRDSGPEFIDNLVQASDLPAVGSSVRVLTSRPQMLADLTVNEHPDFVLRKTLNRILVRLTQKVDRLPASIMLTGIRAVSEEPVAAGGFADIFKGIYQGKAVALKRFRKFSVDRDRTKAVRVSVSCSDHVCSTSSFSLFSACTEKYLYGRRWIIRMSCPC
jgi:hypothetical protein